MAASMESSGQSKAATLMNAARRSHFVSRIEKYEAKVRHAKALMKQQKEAGLRIDQRQPSSDVEEQNFRLKQEQREAVRIAEKRCPISNTEEEQQRAVSDKLMMVIPAEKSFASEQVGFKDKVSMEHEDEVPQKAHERDYLHTEKHDDSHRDVLSDKGFVSQDDVFEQHYRPGSLRQRMCSQQKEMISGMLTRSASSNMKTIVKELDALDIVPGNALTSEKVSAGGVVLSDLHANIYIDFKPPPTSEVSIAAIVGALRVRIKAADMSLNMQEHAFKCARDCLDTVGKLQTKRMAYTLKKEFDKVYGPAWHCIVGTSFGSYVTHSFGGFVYFSLDKVSVLLFKTTVEPIESL